MMTHDMWLCASSKNSPTVVTISVPLYSMLELMTPKLYYILIMCPLCLESPKLF
jgi:hypothetical protein